MGVATYGRCFTLENPQNTELYAPTVGPGVEGPYTRAPGFLGYNEVSGQMDKKMKDQVKQYQIDY